MDLKITVSALVKEVNRCFRQIRDDENRGRCWRLALNFSALLRYNSDVKHWVWDCFLGLKFSIPWPCKTLEKRVLDNYPNFFHGFQESGNTS